MCIAIYKPQDKKISYETLQQCFKSNPDGAGFMYADGKQLQMQKGFFTFEDFWKAYKKHEKKQAVIHFRIKTHGSINEENCHPFLINNSIGFVHNGVISGFGIEDKSDTNHFNEDILKPLVSKWGNLSLFQPAIKSLIESRIGYSKLIFLDRHGNYDIFNEEKGVWDNDVWYSNTSYKPYVAPPVPKTQTPLYYGSYYPTQKKASSYLKIGDMVKLTRDYFCWDTKQKFKKDIVFEVIAVNNYYTVDLMCEDEELDSQFAYNVPFNVVELILDDDEVIVSDTLFTY